MTELWEQMATPTRLGKAIGREYMGRGYVTYPWLLHAEGRILDAIRDPDLRFIILNVPPQWGKTTFSGMLLPAWYLGMYPHHQVIFVGYSETYAESWGLKTKNLLDRYGRKFFNVGVSKQTSASANWKTTQGFGGMLSVGIGGGITGNPGNLIIIDDVIKTIEEASSITTKRKHLSEYDGAISSRFQERNDDENQPGSTVLITATRFADDDLSGSLIERMDKAGYAGDKWEVIRIPALAEIPEDERDAMTEEQRAEWRDFLGRAEGEGAEARFSRSFYEQRRSSIDPYVWSAVYQQNPSHAEDGMFPPQHWRYWDDTNLPFMERKVRIWDLATTEGGGDWTVGALFGRGSNGDLYLLKRERFQRNPAAVEAAVISTAAADGHGVKIMIEQEKAGAGKALVEHYRKKLAGYLVEPAKIDGSKEVRATAYSAMQRNGRVWLPKADPELCKQWIAEHKRMMGDGRRPRHDDQIDTGAYATLELIGSGNAAMWIPGENDDLASAALRQQAAMRSLIS
jgi:predicted phage terminase large subunit-like protein